MRSVVCFIIWYIHVSPTISGFSSFCWYSVLIYCLFFWNCCIRCTFVQTTIRVLFVWQHSYYFWFHFLLWDKKFSPTILLGGYYPLVKLPFLQGVFLEHKFVRLQKILKQLVQILYYKFASQSTVYIIMVLRWMISRMWSFNFILMRCL